MSNKTTVAIIYGGRSVEHEISIRSAVNVVQYIDKTKYEVVIMGIDKSGKWHLMNAVNDAFESGDSLSLLLDASSPRLINQQSGQAITIDVVFPVLHGTDGEDGSIQGLLKSMNIPFAGSGVLGSSVSMDKLISKQLLFQAGIPVSKFDYCHISDRDEVNFEEIKNKVGLPLIVKPVNLGSSVGITKVKNEEDFHRAVKVGFTFDHTLLFEEFIVGRELECAVLGNKNPKASHPGEIIISDQYEFYSYDAKYNAESSVTTKIPAEVENNILEEMQSLCVKSYQVLQCNDFARVDLFLAINGQVYINEINTIPGFTDISMFPTLWAQHGIDYPSLITEIIELAIARTQATEGVERSFK